jgi:hypothetical protein
VVERLEAGAVEPPGTAPSRRPAPRRSSSSLAGAQVRWTGA